MDELFALVVGIDRYPPPVPSLRGCGNDADHVVAHLTARVPAQRMTLRVLRDEQATRAAVEAGFREHLALAGDGDTVLFWFSGHGSQSPAPAELLPFEGTGMSQTLVCAGPRSNGDDGVGSGGGGESDDGEPADLLDAELAVLISLAGAGGAHVVVVLDCCHADGASRGDPDDLGASVRSAPPLAVAPRMEQLLPELRAGTGKRNGQLSDLAGPHAVLLSACGVDQPARERRLDGEIQGIFSFGLLRLLNRPGAYPTYRDLMTGTRALVEDRTRDQQPVLRPMTKPMVDQPFLGRRLGTPLSAVIMRSVRDTWEVNVGACHGLAANTRDEHTMFGVVEHSQHASAANVRQVRVAQVLTERSIVTPVGWLADPATQYPVVLTGAPTPKTTVSIGAGQQEHAGTVALLVRALRGTVAGPSPHLRLVDGTASDEPADILVRCPKPGLVALYGPNWRAGGRAPTRTEVTTHSAAADVVETIEHMARWSRIKTLANPASSLTGMARVEIVPALPDEHDVPERRAPLPADGTGALRLAYQRDGDVWRAPNVFIRIRNSSDRRLYCAVLDLTDRYEIDAGLFEGDWVGPGQTVWIDRSPLQLALPPGEEPYEGATIRDWLLLLATELPFDTTPFTLGRLGDPATRRNRAPMTPTNMLESLGLRSVRRERHDTRTTVCDWTTSIMPIVTCVPEMVSQR